MDEKQCESRSAGLEVIKLEYSHNIILLFRKSINPDQLASDEARPQGYKTRVHSQTQTKAP